MVKEELSGNVAKTFVGQISRFHRVQASTMFHEASEYVKNELVKIGIDDASIEQFTADGATEYWTHTSPIGWTVNSAELRLVEPENRLIVSYDDTPQSLHTHSNATPPEGVTADLVDVGSGTKPSDYEGKNVDGKFVLATGRARRVHELAVQKYGAAGVITDTITLEMPDVRESLDIPDAHAYQGIWPSAEDLPKAKFGFSLTKRQGSRVRALLSQGRPVKLKARVDARLFSGKMDVVTATIQGSSKPDEEIFLIAHLCHPKPSANDNASGSGLLLEIARTMRVLIDSGRIERPTRTIRFLWVPETNGSVAYLHRHEDLSKRMVAGINLDMVGQDQELCRSTLNLDRTPDSLPSYLNDYVFSLFERSVKEFDASSPFGSSSTFRYAMGPFSGGSDHAEFTDSTIGVPCIMLLQWPDLYYHTSLDTIDKVSASSLKRVGWIATVAALTLASATAEEGCLFAAETASRGISRIWEIWRAKAEEFFEKKRDPTLKDKSNQLVKELVQIAYRGRSKIEHVVWREQQAVRSVTGLGKNAALLRVLERCCIDIADAGQKATARLEETLNTMVSVAGVVLSKTEVNSKNDELKQIIPRRLFKGTLSFEFLKKRLGERDFEWYLEIDKKDAEYTKKAAEILNFIDGKRSMHWILNAVSAEYSAIESEHAMKFIKDLERLNLVELQRA
jgi:hypothetical protein